MLKWSDFIESTAQGWPGYMARLPDGSGVVWLLNEEFTLGKTSVWLWSAYQSFPRDCYLQRYFIGTKRYAVLEEARDDVEQWVTARFALQALAGCAAVEK